jgi:hypothetical protein
MLGTLSAAHHFMLRRARDDPKDCRQFHGRSFG